MLPSERDSGLLWDMRAFAQEVLAFAEGHSLQDIESDLVLRRAVERDIEIIGEAARQVSLEFQADHPEIPWQQIINQRNFLAHGYQKIDVARLWDVIQSDLPILLDRLDSLIPPETRSR